MFPLAFTLTLVFLFSVIAGDCSEYSLVDKTVILTGGAQGIGYATADIFLSEGAKLIIILDKNGTSGAVAAEALNTKYGSGKAVFILCNVHEDLHVWDDLVSTYEQLDILVNNAGIIDEYDVVEMVRTNVEAPIAWSINFRNYNRIDRNGKGGHIINLASRAGYMVYPFMSAYSATKSAVKSFTQNFGHDYNFKMTGIRMVAICPDLTHTWMTEQQMVEDEQLEDFLKLRAASTWQDAEDVAKAAVVVYKTAATGTAWTVSGGNITEAPVVEYITSEDIAKM